MKKTICIIASSIACFACNAAKCPTCNGKGKVEVVCNVCNGSGYEIEQQRYSQGSQIQWVSFNGNSIRTKQYGTRNMKVACKKCFKGLRGPDSVGEGKVKETCQTCNGRGYVSNRKLKSHTQVKSEK